MSAPTPSPSPAAHAELHRLARRLGVDVGDLAVLRDAPVDALRELRVRASDDLDAHGEAGLRRLAALARRLPGPIAAVVAERALGPALCARAAPYMDATAVGNLVPRMSLEFLTGVVLTMETRRIVHLLAVIPDDTLADVSVELERREAWMTIGDITGHLDPGPLRVALAAITDNSVLQALPWIEDEATVTRVADALAPDRAALRRTMSDRTA
ncbi:MAG: hypothetical protein M0P31_04080 [Solirubrobacteraceae bacterium]|nr:hypothetical protein [Solirubrobacteraceae bacterium]